MKEPYGKEKNNMDEFTGNGLAGCLKRRSAQ
jgi:hypothetical protein